MKTVGELLKEISDITRDIETNYPDVYKYLDENPITIPNLKHPKVDTNQLQVYLESLNDLLNKYKKNHY
jgi:hypothetical protein